MDVDFDAAVIVKEQLQPPSSKHKLLFLLHNVVSKPECERLIRMTEDMGYEHALVNIGGGRQKLMPDVRNNQRCIWDSEQEASKLWARIGAWIPQDWTSRRVVGLNERLRFLRYDPGEYFAPHYDGMYLRDSGERSFITVQLYLNEGFTGGATTFLGPNGFFMSSSADLKVVPKTGSVLIFQHDILHEGSLLTSGRKYAMRTDVMYSATKDANT